MVESWTLLLDIDGVLVTTPPWRKPELSSDGFLTFDSKAAANLNRILAEVSFSVVLTTTHRINYSNELWVELLNNRGITVSSVSKINELQSLTQMPIRRLEIEDWVNRYGSSSNFIIIDDDPTLYELPNHIAEHCIITRPTQGLDETATTEALHLINMLNQQSIT